MEFEKWQEKKVGEVLTLKRGYDLPVKKRIDGVYPILSSSGVSDFHNEHKVNGPGVTTGRSGLLGKVYYIEKDFWPLNTSLYVQDFKGNDPKYIYYLLQTLKLENYNAGSSVPTLNRNHVHLLNIAIPSTANQKRIGDILYTFEKKIENNNQIINQIEQLAQTLFKRWFVDFEFPNENGEPYKSSGGEMVESEFGIIPTIWSVGEIGDVVNVKSGFAFKSAWWSSKGDSVIKIKDIENGTLNLDELSHVDQEKSILAGAFKVNAGDMLIALTGATLGKFGLVPKTEKNLYANQRVGKFFLGEEPLRKIAFVHCLISQSVIINEIIDRGSGSAQANLSPRNLESIKIKLPNIELINSFNKKLMPLYELLVLIPYENSKLKSIRDTLLPKLLSGEIEIPDEAEVIDDVPI